jgi:N-acetylneuraminic acid mutarotase
MKVRYLRGLAVLAAVAVVFSGASALAASPKSAAVKLKFKSGPDSPFDLAGGTRFDGYYIADQKRVYFLGLREADDSTSGEVWYYDTAKKKYVDTGTAMPTPVSNYSIAGLTDKTGFGLYIFGGRDASASIVTDVQVYYPDTNTAAKLGKKDAWPGTTSPTGCVSLPAMGVATVGNNAYVLGGVAFAGNGCADENSDQTWVFNPKGKSGKKWSQGPKLTQARGYITTAVLGGKIYAIGGDVNDAAVLTAQTTVESWDTKAAKWKKATDLSEPCDETQAFGFDKGPLAGTITVTGCGQWPNGTPDVLQYDATSKKWSNVGSLLQGRRNQAGANIGTDSKPQLFLVGGYDVVDGATVLETSEIGTVSKSGLQWTRVAPHGATRGATTS